MSKLRFTISLSLDGYVAGPNQSQDAPLGEGGEDLHTWVLGLRGWREAHGLEGGRTDAVDSRFANAMDADCGAFLMGRNMFGPVRGSWDSAPAWNGWWGEDPPYHGPVFVLTHHAREPVEMQGGTTFHFVTDGIEAALERARAAAAGKDVLLWGGANTAQQYLRAGLVDEMVLHVVPNLLGGGERLWDDLGDGLAAFACTELVASPAVAHYTYVRK